MSESPLAGVQTHSLGHLEVEHAPSGALSSLGIFSLRPKYFACITILVFNAFGSMTPTIVCAWIHFFSSVKPSRMHICHH